MLSACIGSALIAGISERYLIAFILQDQPSPKSSGRDRSEIKK
jgi:hypothetical protein